MSLLELYLHHLNGMSLPKAARILGVHPLEIQTRSDLSKAYQKCPEGILKHAAKDYMLQRLFQASELDDILDDADQTIEKIEENSKEGDISSEITKEGLNNVTWLAFSRFGQRWGDQALLLIGKKGEALIVAEIKRISKKHSEEFWAATSKKVSADAESSGSKKKAPAKKDPEKEILKALKTLTSESDGRILGWNVWSGAKLTRATIYKALRTRGGAKLPEILKTTGIVEETSTTRTVTPTVEVTFKPDKHKDAWLSMIPDNEKPTDKHMYGKRISNAFNVYITVNGKSYLLADQTLLSKEFESLYYAFPPQDLDTDTTHVINISRMKKLTPDYVLGMLQQCLTSEPTELFIELGKAQLFFEEARAAKKTKRASDIHLFEYCTLFEASKLFNLSPETLLERFL